MEEEPRTTSARIRADYRRWQQMVEAYVRERRDDLLIEIAPDSPGHFLDGARRHQRSGYRVELVVIGARVADSRLSTAARCAELARLSVAPPVHDGCRPRRDVPPPGRRGPRGRARAAHRALGHRAAPGHERRLPQRAHPGRGVGRPSQGRRRGGGGAAPPLYAGGGSSVPGVAAACPGRAAAVLARSRRDRRAGLPLMPACLRPHTLASTIVTAPLPLPWHRTGTGHQAPAGAPPSGPRPGPPRAVRCP
ncbi:zeta toxin family protein (plasmid) [Streptomyces sp. QH1-20]|uniref:zeta toxin family protein n=1 Tax=Streptomyces sp. QH1-20 TaxID=3240934 RepID=UPI0035194AF9